MLVFQGPNAAFGRVPFPRETLPMMMTVDLRGVAELVARRARRQGYVVPREVREELTRAGEPEHLWKDVLALARPSLSYRHGRYYYQSPVSDRVREEESHQRGIRRAVREVIRSHHNSDRAEERRGQERVEFIQPVRVITEDGRQFTLLTRDLSPSGLRLIGTRRLLGQKVRILMPKGERSPAYEFVLRILWTCSVGEDLVENGGAFVGVTPCGRE